MNILGKRGAACEAYQPSNGLTPEEVGNIQRYLDAVRCNLLFAKSVILVEGDAEEILIPILVKKVLGISLDELGISLINIRSTGFKNVAVLFHDVRIRKRCRIITDLDAAFIDTTPALGDTAAQAKFKAKCQAAQTVGLSRKASLESLATGNKWLGTNFADHTFEVDFIAAGNAAKVVSLVESVYTDPNTIAEAKADLESVDKARFGRRVLTMAANQGKGWFAILLGKSIDYQTIIPPYITDAVLLAHYQFSTEILFNILSYRLHCIVSSFASAPAVTDAFRARLNLFRERNIDWSVISAEMQATFPDDQINPIIAKIV